MTVELNEIKEAEVELEEWLIDQAGNGIPEIVLIGLLRNYADEINTSAMCCEYGDTPTTDSLALRSYVQRTHPDSRCDTR